MADAPAPETNETAPETVTDPGSVPPEPAPPQDAEGASEASPAGEAAAPAAEGAPEPSATGSSGDAAAVPAAEGDAPAADADADAAPATAPAAGATAEPEQQDQPPTAPGAAAAEAAPPQDEAQEQQQQDVAEGDAIEAEYEEDENIDYAEVVHDGASREVARFGDHVFTQADVDDITRIQAVVRRQHSRKDIEGRRIAREQAEQADAAADVAPITMPEDSDDDEAAAGPTSAAATTVDKNGSIVFAKRHVGRRPAPTGAPPAAAAKATAGGKPRGSMAHPRFQKVDTSELKVAGMSRDTQGMQHVYSRMLHSKDWW